MAFHHLRDRGEIDERRWTNAPPHGLGGSVGYHIVAFLALRTLDRDVGFADRWAGAFHHHLEVMDHRLHFAGRLGFWRQDYARVVYVHRAIGKPVRCLLEDADGLTHFLESHQVTVIDIAVGADRDLEVVGLVVEVWKILAHVVIDARRAQHWPRQSPV